MTAIDGETYIGANRVGVSPAVYEEALTKIQPQLGDRIMYQYQLDGRYINSLQEQCTYMINNLTGIMQYCGVYFYPIVDGIPQDFWRTNGIYIYMIYNDWAGHTGTVFNLNIPTDCSDFNRLYGHVRRATGNSMQSAGILTFDGTFRNAKQLRWLNLERHEMTEATQLSLLADIWNEIENGMGGDYTATSTTTRVIDFQNTSTGANALITETALVSAGWTKISTTQYYRYISQGGVDKRWRVYINNT